MQRDRGRAPETATGHHKKDNFLYYFGRSFKGFLKGIFKGSIVGFLKRVPQEGLVCSFVCLWF